VGRKTPSYQRRETELRPSVDAAPTPRRGLDLSLYGLQAALADLSRVDQDAADMARRNIANQLVDVALHIDQQTKDRKESEQ